jgi:hypothetical protein
VVLDRSGNPVTVAYSWLRKHWKRALVAVGVDPTYASMTCGI